MPHPDTPPYVAPTVTDLGSLVDMTLACVGAGTLDESFKGDDPAFQFASPAFGDPSFCSAN